ncbi:MAG: DUF4062 domain-containing protein [Promethearchaeota archaeon]
MNKTKTFRIFVSSTFRDMKEERNILQQKVFPDLRELCMANGTRFQAVDLRWGISEEAYLSQKTVDICLSEIIRCQNISPRPNFIILLGDRYGSRPPPSKIPAYEFEAIIKNISNNESKKKERYNLLNQWYQKDENAVPPVYCLKSRENKFRKHEVWNPIAQKIVLFLRESVSELSFGLKEEIKYFASVTEQEVIQGALGIPGNYDHVFCFLRSIKNLPKDKDAKDFIDLDNNNKRDTDAFRRLEQLKKQIRKNFTKNVFDYEAEWTGEGITTDHLEKFRNDVYNALAKIIMQEITKLKQLDSLEMEILDHDYFGIERAKNFKGREVVIDQIRKYIDRIDNNPLAVYGEAGSGKSALLAFTIEKIQETNPKAELIFRFIGVTPGSSYARGLLYSICHQVARLYGRDESRIPMDYNKLIQVFPNLLALATEDKPIIILIDALDQLSNIDESRNLVWLPRILPPHVKIIVSTLPVDTFLIIKEKLPHSNFIELKPMSAVNGLEILTLWLKNENRTLQPDQKQAVIEKFSANGLPLYLRLVFEEILHWKSHTKKVILSPDIPSVIRDLFKRLSDEANHGKIIVSRSLGYLAATRNGLTEDEMLDILSYDDIVYNNFIERAFHRPPQKRLPIIIWSRLYHDLETYLSERRADNANLMTFYHHELEAVVQGDYLNDEIKGDLYQNLACYFNDQPFQTGEGQTIVFNLRKLSELPFCIQFLKIGMFKDKDKEKSVLQGAAKCLIMVCKNFELDLDQHLNEIEPIVKWLIDIEQYEDIIDLTDATAPLLEKQCRWPVIQTILSLAVAPVDKLKLIQKKLSYQYGISKALYHRGKYAESIDIGEVALNLSKKINSKELESEILWHIGAMWRFQGNKDHALKFLTEAEKKARTLTNITIQAKCYYSRAIIEHGLGNYIKAIELYNAVLEIGKTKASRRALGELFLDMLRIRGDFGYYRNDFILARESWELLQKYAEEMRSPHWLKRVKARLSLIDVNIDLFQMKQAWAESLQEEMLSGELVSAITGHGELAEICIRRKEKKEAIELCTKAEAIAKQFDNLHARSGEAYVRGVHLLAKDKINKAKKELERSAELFLKWTSPYRYWVLGTMERLKNYINTK